MNESITTDIVIIGAGVVGLALAEKLAKNHRIIVLEKESQWGTGISSRNSEVIHAGLYYPTGSLKAQLCVRGNQLLYAFCDKYQVPYKACGKLVVAQKEELPELEALALQAQKNHTKVQALSSAQLKKKEPAVHAAAALWSPTSGIIDSHELMLRLLTLAEQNGAVLSCNSHPTCISSEKAGVVIDGLSQTEPFRIQCRYLINAAGLGFNDVAKTINNNQHIAPLYWSKGNYFSYSGPTISPYLIYPMPGKHSLGIHYTADLQGQMRFGPDSHYLTKDLQQALSQNPSQINYDVDSQQKEPFFQAIQRYFPFLNADKLQPSYSGVRPKRVPASQPSADFLIQFHPQYPNIIELFGIESPGLTSALAIAEYVNTLID